MRTCKHTHTHTHSHTCTLALQGVLIDEYCLDNIRKLIHHVRNCNVTLRWHLLHRATTNKKYADQIVQSVDVNNLVQLLMSTAQFEYVPRTAHPPPAPTIVRYFLLPNPPDLPSR